MADQVDFPDIYIDASAGDGGVGSEVDPYNEFSDINWTTGGDNSIFDYYAGAPAASVTINLKKGELWRSSFVTYCAGTATYPLTIQAYGTGADPLVYGSILATSATYKWTASGSGTNEFYCELSGGGDPSLAEPTQAWIDGAFCGYGTAGSLADHEFEFTDNDTLGYSTVYIRDDTGDPDTSGVAIEVSAGASFGAIFYLKHDYVTVDGIEVKYSNGHGFRVTGDGSNIIVKNCTATYNYWAGLQIYNGADDSEFRDCEIAYNLGTNISANGQHAAPLFRLLITGCNIHDAGAFLVGGAYWEACGIKAFGLEDSTLEKSTWYDCLSGAIRFDGTGAGEGCLRNTISENEIYGCGGISGIKYPQIEIEFSDDNIISHNRVYDGWGGGTSIRFAQHASSNKALNNIIYGVTADSGITTYTDAGDGGSNEVVGNTFYNCYYGITNNTDHGLVIKNNAFQDCLYANIAVAAGYSDIVSDYNILGPVVSSPPGEVFYEVGVDWYTLAEWKVYASTDTNSVESSPLLVDPGSEDFELQAGSPCIGAGVNLGGPYNTALMPGSTWPDGVVTGDQDDY